MKPDPTRLLAGTYPLFTTVPSRFRDLDTLGHINNVAIGSFYEEGRAHLNRTAFPAETRHANAMRLLIADTHIAYLAEAHYPGDLEVGAGVLRIGCSSYTVALGLFQNGVCVGTSESVMVNTDGEKPAPLPEDGVARLEQYRLREA